MSRRLRTTCLQQFVLSTLVLAAAAIAAYGEDAPAAAPAQGTPAATAAPDAGAPMPGLGGDLADVLPFDEKTTVKGKIDTKLEGVWLLVAQAQVAKDKYKNFLQLLKVTKGNEGLEFHMLDVRLPADIDATVRDANRKTLTAWVPSDAMLKTLAQNWSKLPAIKQKARDEFLYLNIEYTLAAPSEYAQTFPQQSDYIVKALGDSKLGLKVQEDYRPRPAATSFRGSQVARRTSYYGIKTIDKDVLKGDMITGFVAMGAGTPLPLDFVGTFQMYRVGSL
jgi:hypothetical protein